VRAVVARVKPGARAVPRPCTAKLIAELSDAGDKHQIDRIVALRTSSMSIWE
jgi:hypothetical protein